MSRLKTELRSLTRPELLFVLFAMLTGFCISAEYSITRPASNSIFLSVFSAKYLPHVWLVTIPLNFLLVSLYNWLLPKIGALKMLLSISISVIVINALCGLLLPLFPKLIFFHFCWKDLYILLMFQQLWSMIHSTIPAARAKYLYGIIFGCGTAAMVLGSMIPIFFAVSLGSEKLFFLTVPIYLLLIFSYLRAYQVSKTTEVENSMRASTLQSFSFIVKNRYLLGVMGIVAFMQVFIALTEYQFNYFLEIQTPLQDHRTAYFSGILCWVHLSTVVLQIIGSLFLFSKVSIRSNQMLVPILLTLPVVGSVLNPCFAMVTLGYIVTKSVDWSIFGVTREMLYIPLTVDEKFRAKAIIDVFAYRTSKAVASLVLLSFQLYVGSSIFSYTKTTAFVILAAWLFLVVLLLRQPRPVALETNI